MIVRDAAAGTSRIRDRAEHYLPASPNEKLPQWEERIRRTVHFGATERAQESIVGLIDRHEPSLVTEVPDWLPDTVTKDAPKGLAFVTSLASRMVTNDGMAFIWTSPAWQLVKIDDVLDLQLAKDETVSEFRVRVDAETVWRTVQTV